MAKKLRVTLVKSPIGFTQDQRSTVKTLGLRRMHRTVVLVDNPVVRGMVQKVIHMLHVEEIDE